MDKKTKIYTFISTFLFFLLYFGVKHIQESNLEKGIIGIWQSKKSSGEIFALTFKEDETLYISNGDSTIKFHYEIGSKLIDLAKNNQVVKTYSYKIKSDTLIPSENGVELNFYKKDR